MRYAVVLDAGSTGSRVHTYRFRNGEGGGLELVDDDFHQLKPGLSSFKDDPDKGAASLAPLLDAAKERVPASAHASTPIELRATAGLRLLPEAQAEVSAPSLPPGACRGRGVSLLVVFLGIFGLLLNQVGVSMHPEPAVYAGGG